MGTISNPRAIYGLLATGTHTKTNVANDAEVGNPTTTIPLTGATKAYTVSATLASNGDTLTIDTETGVATIGTTPVAQVETATAAGTITGSGNATVVVTGARITGSPVTLSVAVLSGDTASDWAAKVRAALTANTAIAAVYTVSGAGTSIVLTETDPQNNDSTLNISLDNGTCTGITTAATSANTTAGVGGVKLTNNTGDGNDFEGVDLGSIAAHNAILVKCISGEVAVYHDGGAIVFGNLGAGAILLFANGTSASLGSGDLVLTAQAASEVEITIAGA